MIVILNSMPGNSYTPVSLRLISGDLFVPMTGPFFLVCVLCNFVLVSAQLKKQSTLPVFMDRHHTGKYFHQSAQLEILGASQTFSVDVSSLNLGM